MFARLKEDIAIVFERDPAARTTWEVLTTYPGVHALIIHRWARALWRRNFLWLGRMLSHIGRGMTGIEIHPGAKLGRRVFIDHGMGVVVGETAEIGDDCTLYHGVTLGGTSWKKGKRHPTLERGVVVGAGAKILGPITVGENAKVGSNAVVVKDVPPGATVVGIPGRILDESVKQRVRSVEHAGFTAYALTENMDDPLVKAINAIVDHGANVDDKITAIFKHLQELGVDLKNDAKMSPAVDVNYLDK